MTKPIVYGFIASSALLLLYTVVITLVSGWNLLEEQIGNYWYYLLSLSLGFGIQVGLYSHLRFQSKAVSSRVVAASGTTSTLAMISCCSHYLVNLLPILGIAGIVTIIAQYQIELFGVGLLFNLAGILYLISKVRYVKTSI